MQNAVETFESDNLVLIDGRYQGVVAGEERA
jgi:hypothetical protein